MADVLHEQIHETRFQLTPDQLGWPFDGSPQFFFGHWSNEAVMIRQSCSQVGICRALPIKVGAHGKNHQRLSLDDLCRIKKVADEGLAELFFATKRKQFLELVYQDYQPHVGGIFG